MNRLWLTPGISRIQARNLIGEVLYPKFLALWTAEKKNLPEYINAGRITGMTVELPIKDIDHLVDDPEALKAKYEEAKAVLTSFYEPRQQPGAAGQN